MEKWDIREKERDEYRKRFEEWYTRELKRLLLIEKWVKQIRYDNWTKEE